MAREVASAARTSDGSRADREQPEDLQPLTERILERLPGPRERWILAWALVPWLNAVANLALGGDRTSAVWEQSDLLLILNYVSLSVGVVVTLWGSRRLADRLEQLRTDARRVLGASPTRVFGAINNVAFPLTASVASAFAFGAAALERDGWGSAFLRGGSWFVLGLAFWTFIWTYATLQVGLVRLGREHLRVDAPHIDPTLGLRPFGTAAFMGLWMLLVWLVPVVLTGLSDVVGVIVGLLVLVVGLGFFFVTLHRLHRQMLEVKERELAVARDLYAQAYEPVWQAPRLEVLDRQQKLLGAADALERRANAIDEWPISDATFAWVIGITTSVLAMSIGRAILKPLGL